MKEDTPSAAASIRNPTGWRWRLRAEGLIAILSQSELAIRDSEALAGLAGGLR